LPVSERILLVDDEPSVHEVVRAYLERDGFAVASADNGRDGLTLAERERPQLIVLDLAISSGRLLDHYLTWRGSVPGQGDP
jgi:DNA-binding response OmpR family regulator